MAAIRFTTITLQQLRRRFTPVNRNNPRRISTSQPGLISPLSPSAIRQVDPTKLQPVPINKKAAPRNTPVPSLKRWSAAMVAGAATLLVPALALAGSPGIAATAQSLFSAIGLSFLPAGVFLASAGLYLSLRKVVKMYKELKVENYQNPESTLVTGNLTPKKLLKQLVLPAFCITVTTGLFMNFSPLLSQALGLELGAVSWGAFWLISGMAAASATVRTIRDCYHALRFKFKYEQQNVIQGKLIPKILTNIYANGAWVAGTVFMAHVAKIYTTQFINLSFNFTRNAYVTFSSGANLSSLGTFGLVCAGIAVAYHLILGRGKARIGNPLKNYPSLLKSSFSAALKGAIAGALLSWAGLGLTVTNVFVFSICMAFAHNFIHSTRSQEGGMTQKEKKQDIHPLQDLWKVVRNAGGTARTVFKPSIDMIDPLISGYIMMLLSEGANWVLNAISGAFNAAQYKDGMIMIEKLNRKDAMLMRRIIRRGYEKLMGADTAKEALEAVMVAFDEVAKFTDDDQLTRMDLHDGHPMAWGDLKTRSGGFLRLKDKTFCAGVPREPNPDVEALIKEEEREGERSDQDLRVHGEHIRFAARIYERKSLEFMLASLGEYQHAELASLKKELAKTLEAYHRRAFPPTDTHPGRFYTNILRDSYNAKQYVIDLCFQVMSSYVSFMDVGVLNADGKIEIWAIPMRVVKDLKEKHEDILSLESRDEQNEDLRFGWYDRFSEDGHGGHDIGNSLCEIAYIDNSAHWQRHKDDISIYPTAETYDTSFMQENEFMDVVYKNGARLRIFGDGRQEVFGKLPENAAAVLTLPRTKRHEFIGQQLGNEYTAEAALNGIGSDGFRTENAEQAFEHILSRLRQGDVPHPFGGPKDSLSLDRYLFPREHHMYPTWRTSISDADQMDIEASNQELVHARQNPHLRIMFRIPIEEKVPFSPDMIGREYDSFHEAGISLTWMVTKVTLNDRREVFIPLNINKENERTLGGEFWRYIDETQPVNPRTKKGELFLDLPLRMTSKKDPNIHKVKANMAKVPMPMDIVKEDGKLYIRVPMPMEMQPMAEQIKEIKVNPVRHGEVGGPIPVVDFVFTRRKENGKITDSHRKLELSDRVADMLNFGIVSLMSQEEIEHCEMVGANNPKEHYAYTDKQGMVHMRMTEKEYEELKPWIPEAFWRTPPAYDQEAGKLLIQVKHFEELAASAYMEFTYRGFMPDTRFRNYFEPTEIRTEIR